jgi:hypothetical protein
MVRHHKIGLVCYELSSKLDWMRIALNSGARIKLIPNFLMLSAVEGVVNNGQHGKQEASGSSNSVGP